MNVMTPRDFVYWLQGFLELSGSTALTVKQVNMIKKHMALVLTNVTDEPSTEDAGTKPLTAQEELAEELRRQAADSECAPFGPGPDEAAVLPFGPLKLDFETLMKELQKQAKRKFDPSKYRVTCSAGGCLDGMRFC